MPGPAPIPGRDPFGDYPDAPPETPQQAYDRFFRDYHEPDREAVLQKMRAAMGAPGGGALPPVDPATGDTPRPPGGSGGGSSGRGDPEGFRAAWFASGGRTVTDLANFVRAHPEFGATITGSKGSKIVFPGGQAFQAVRSAGLGGGIGAAWDDLGSGGGEGGGVNVGDFGSLARGWDKPFNAPSIEEIRNSPGYQFALQEGVKALDTSAAARGTVLGGGQKKDILQYATGLLDQTAQTKYQNALGEYMNQYQIFRNNGNDIFNRFDALAGRGANAANSATS